MPNFHGRKRGGKKMHKPIRYHINYELQPSQDHAESTSNQQNTDEEANTYFRHPGHLKGKEIGLFYRDRHLKRKQLEGSQEGSSKLKLNAEQYIPIFMKPNFIPPIVLSDNRTAHIQRLLSAELPASFNIFHDSSFKREFLCKVSECFEDKLQSALITNEIPINETIDQKYLQEFQNKKDRDMLYSVMEKNRMRLPAYKQKDDLIKLIKENQVVVISGETGCGKTTQVAQFILEDCLLNGTASKCRIICTQPRRISAVTVAERVAQEMNEKLGQSVGYQIRLEKTLPRQHGSILFATTGVVVTQMVSDPSLSSASHLIIDEIHERDVLSDFILTLSKMIIEKRKDLKLILMSATLNADKFSAYFKNCPHINIPGFTYPVKEYYLEDVLSFTNFQFDRGYGDESYEGAAINRKPKSQGRNAKNFRREFVEMIEPHVRRLKDQNLYPKNVCMQLRNPDSEELNLNLIYELICYVCRTQDDGAILVFLPGYGDISGLMSIMNKSEKFPAHKYVLYGLHSQMPTIQQKEIFQRPRAGVRKIIIATNIAETSITIDDVVFVVDCGKIKMTNYDNENNIQTLLPEWVSLANANQRRGRAGRVQAGVCYHLFSQVRKMLLEQYQKPEILRSRLEETVLKIKILQLGDTHAFLQKCMDPPDPSTVDVSIKFLQSLNALDSKENLTPLGYHLAKLPIHPQMGKMILLGAIFSCLDPILSIAASLGFKTPFLKPLGQEKQADRAKLELSDGLKSDHLLLHQALLRYERLKQSDFSAAKQFCWEYYMSYSILDMLLNMKKQFAEYLHDMNFISSNNHKAAEVNLNSENVSLIKAIVCGGLYPNVGHLTARIKKNNQRYNRSPPVRTLDGKRAKLHPSSINEQHQFTESTMLVYFTRIKSTALYLHDVTLTHPLPILFFGPNTEKKVSAGAPTMKEAAEAGESSSSVVDPPTRTVIVVDNQISMRCDEDTADLILQLKDRLNLLLEYKVSHPGTVDWSADSMETVTLRAIKELITSEDFGVLHDDFEDYEDDFDEDSTYSDY